MRKELMFFFFYPFFCSFFFLPLSCSVSTG
ncbi:hypothetical protein [Sicyoidochytrium minutum DNA virus]|nr:hypothetical protein [Sicyoidochytrium minutum DNA virus]